MSPYAVVIGATLIWLVAIVSPRPNFLVVSRLALSRSRRFAVGLKVALDGR
jgi:threonine/homoserine/homoserine lactone efflux protein